MFAGRNKLRVTRGQGRGWASLGAAWAALLLPVCATLSVHAACLSTPQASLSLPARPGPPVIAARVDGGLASFVLDSGSERTLLSSAAVERLGLKLDEWTSTAMRGIGGIERHRDAAVSSLSIAGIPLSRRLGPVRSLPVAPGLNVPADGLLGADLLAAQDLELTGGGLTLILSHATGCAGLSPQAVLPLLYPWAEAVEPNLAVHPGLFIIAVRIGGTTLRALVDTGATVSVIAPWTAARLGVEAPALRTGVAGMAHGVGPAQVPLRLHDFGPVTLATPARGGEAIALGAGPLWVGALPPRMFDLLLGMDRLRALRLGLSHAANAVYVARLSHTD